MTIFRHFTVPFLLASFALCSPMHPSNPNDKGKSLSDTFQEDHHMPFLNPSIPNMQSTMLPSWENTNWAMYPHSGISSNPEHWNAFGQQSTQNLHLSSPPDHTIVKPIRPVGRRSHSNEQYLDHDFFLYHGPSHGLDYHHQGPSSSSLEHRTEPAAAKKNTSREEMDELMQDLNEDPEMTSNHSHGDSDSERELDEEGAQGHEQGTTTDHSGDFHAGSTGRTQGSFIPGNRGGYIKGGRGRRSVNPASRRAQEVKRQKAFETIWYERGFNVNTDPKLLALQVAALRLENLPFLDSKTVGQRASHLVKLLRTESREVDDPNAPEDTYAFIFAKYMRDLSNSIFKVRKWLQNDQRSTNLSASQYNETLLREAFRRIEEKEARADKGPSKRKEIRERVQKVGRALKVQLLVQGSDFRTVDAANLAEVARNLEVDGLEQDEVIRNVKKFLNEDKRVGKDAVKLIVQKQRLAYSREYQRQFRRLKQQRDDNQYSG